MQWAGVGGGFSAGGRAFDGQHRRHRLDTHLGFPAGTNIVGTLMFNSPTARYAVTSGTLNLNGSDRTIPVDDNTASSSDSAIMSGVIPARPGCENGAGQIGSLGRKHVHRHDRRQRRHARLSTAPSLPARLFGARGTLNLGTRSQSIGTFQITGGTVTGTGTLTSNAAYDIQGGTVGATRAALPLEQDRHGHGDPQRRRHLQRRHHDQRRDVAGGHRHERRPANGINYSSPISLDGGVYQSSCLYV